MESRSQLLSERIDSGQPLLLAELCPPPSGDSDTLRKRVGKYRGRVHALGLTDNQHGVGMSALAAAFLSREAGVEPVLHMVTRDQNRTGLVATYLGAQALGIPNVLCTSGVHQTLGAARAACPVFDLDVVQLLHACANLHRDASLVGEPQINGAKPLCLGAVASPFADPPELQVLRVMKKVRAGARFLITQSVFDLARFRIWWRQVRARGLDQEVAIVARVEVLTSAEAARSWAGRRPSPEFPKDLLSRICSHTESGRQRAAGIDLALELLQGLAEISGLRGFALGTERDDLAVLEVLDRAALSVS